MVRVWKGTRLLGQEGCEGNINPQVVCRDILRGKGYQVRRDGHMDWQDFPQEAYTCKAGFSR